MINSANTIQCAVGNYNQRQNKVVIDPVGVIGYTVLSEHLLSLKGDPNNFIFPVCFKTSWCALTLRGTKTIKIHLNLEKSGWQPSHSQPHGGQ